MFALINLFMHCSKVCFLMLAVCARNLFSLYLFNRNSVWSVLYMYLISFSCTLCLCYCLLLLTNLKYGLGHNSTKSINCRATLSDMPCLGCASLKLTNMIVYFMFYLISCLCAMPCLLELPC